jgi:hypothetical protein
VVGREDGPSVQLEDDRVVAVEPPEGRPDAVDRPARLEGLDDFVGSHATRRVAVERSPLDGTPVCHGPDRRVAKP